MGREVYVESVDGLAPPVIKPAKQNIQVSRAWLRDLVSLVLVIAGASLAITAAGVIAGIWAALLVVGVLIVVVGIMLGS